MAPRDYAKLNEQLASQAAKVRENKNLSDEGKRRLLAAATVKAQATAAQWRDEDAQANAKARRATEQRLFGLKWMDKDNPAAVVSMRDAHERASRITTAAEAGKLLDRAVTSGDYALQRAILARAFDPETGDMSSVVEAYAAHNPDTQADIQELVGHEMANAQANSAGGKLFGHIATTVVAPSELSGIDPYRLGRLAEQAGDVTESVPAPTFDAKVFGGAPGWGRVQGDTVADAG